MTQANSRYRRGDVGWVRRRRCIVLGQAGDDLIIRRYINDFSGFGPARVVAVADFRKSHPDAGESARLRALAEAT